jgi:hypothetical protein
MSFIGAIGTILSRTQTTNTQQTALAEPSPNAMTGRQLVGALERMFSVGESLTGKSNSLVGRAHQVMRIKCEVAREGESTTDQTISKCRHMQQRLNNMLNHQPGDEVYFAGNYDKEIMAERFGSK